jgi:hypothetical protein
VLWSLCAIALGPQDALREPAARALLSAPYALDRDALSLAFSLSARVQSARGAGPRERAALARWVSRGGDDPLEGADAAAMWQAWIKGRERPEMLDYALLLSTAGARRAELEHLRSVTEHVILTLRGRAAPETGALWRWLATGGADGRR